MTPESFSEHFAMQDHEQWDSLKHMELISALEDGFQVEFDFDEIIRMQDLDTIQRVLEGKTVAA